MEEDLVIKYCFEVKCGCFAKRVALLSLEISS